MATVGELMPRRRPPQVPLDQLPKVDPLQLVGEELVRYRRFSKAIQLYYQQKSMALVVAAVRCSEENFRRVLRRFWSIADDGRPLGYRALILHARAVTPVRYRPICDERGKLQGTAGIFMKLLHDHPSIEKGLIKILSPTGKNKPAPNRVQMGYLHDNFLTLCSVEKIEASKYPFNTYTRGLDGLRRWYREVFLPQRSLEGATQDVDDADLIEVRPGPYRLWQIDEVRIDVSGRHETLTDDFVWVSYDAARATGILVKDVDLGLSFSFEYVYGAAATASDLLTAFWKAISGPLKVTTAIAELDYAPGAGFPATVIAALRFALPICIQLDNAFAHLADAFRTALHSVCAVKVTLGRPKVPKARASVEAELSVLARNLTHQVPATSGTGPTDPIRKAAQVPVESRLRTNELAHALDVYWANKNVTPCRASFYMPPLSRLISIAHSGSWEPVRLPPDAQSAYFFGQRVEKEIQVEKGSTRDPYINFKGRRYVGDVLKRFIAFPKTKVIVRSNDCDLRKVSIYELNGAQIGELRAEGVWGVIPHDERIRRLYARLRYEAGLKDRPDREPLRWLLNHLRNGAPRDANKALALAHVMEYLLPKVHELAALKLFEATELLKDGPPKLHLVKHPLSTLFSAAQEEEDEATTDATPSEAEPVILPAPPSHTHGTPPPQQQSKRRVNPADEQATVKLPPLRRPSNVLSMERQPERYLLPKKAIRR